MGTHDKRSRIELVMEVRVKGLHPLEVADVV